MRIGLFIPCYIDQFYPEVGKATLELLQKQGCEVEYPLDQTCCGQPLSNTGFHKQTKSIQELFTRNFRDFDYVVSPSGSCTLHVREHLESEDVQASTKVRTHIYELVEFIHDVLKKPVEATFPHKVGLHASCHGLRGLRLASGSERVVEPFDKVRDLLSQVAGLELMKLNHNDECCGFGGTFAIKEEELSVKMGLDRLQDHISNGVEVITAADMSCLMHLEGLAKRRKLNIRFAHVAQILNSSS